MDSVTHIVIGACIGELALPERLGKKRLWIGALAQSFPDIDIIGSLWLSPTEDLLFHRSITHSLLFALLASLLFSFLCKRWFRSYQFSPLNWLIFFLFQFCLHDALDTCNTYGTGLLEPFTHQRFSLDLLYVADPLFTLIPLLLFIGLYVLKSRRTFVRKRMAATALMVPFLYLSFIVFTKRNVVARIKDDLQKQQITSGNLIVTPSTFNSLLWYVITPADTGYYIGYRSVFDNNNYRMPVRFYPKNDSLLSTIKHKPDVTNLVRFARDEYTIEKENSKLSFNVIRFGQVFGWRSGQPAPFAFHYYLDSTADNTLVVQRGRFTGWNSKAVKDMLQRIKGY